jgi:CheY-like chemotaxis protein
MISKKEALPVSTKERIARYLRVADYMVKEGKLEEAVIQIEKALQLDPKNYYARSFLERLRSQMEKVQQRRMENGEAKTISDEQRLEQISLLLRAADQFIAAKNYKLALQQVAKVYAIDPQNYYAQAYSDRIDQLIAQEKRTISLPPSMKAPTPAPTAAALSRFEWKAGERASIAMYRELLKEVWFDGKVTDDEAKELKKVRDIFKITDEDHKELEKQVHIDAYIEALRIAWRDGVISQNENDVLQMMRHKFNISMEEHMSAEAKILWAKSTPHAKAAVMLVDDERTFLLSLAAKLRKHGYDVLTAESVELALEQLQRSLPAIIVADLLYGEGKMTGLEFYQKVRENSRLKNIPFLLMSGISDEFVVRAGMRLGVDNFIQKPFDLELLLATIEGKLK